MAYNLTTLAVGASQITATDDTARAVLGARVKAYDSTYGEGEFMYLQNGSGGALTVGQLVTIDEKLGTMVAATVAASRGPVGVVMAPSLASLQYGYVQVQGSAVLWCNGAVVAQAPVYETATAGKVDDAVVAASKVDGAVFKTADGTPAANFAVAQISFPSANGNG